MNRNVVLLPSSGEDAFARRLETGREIAALVAKSYEDKKVRELTYLLQTEAALKGLEDNEKVVPALCKMIDFGYEQTLSTAHYKGEKKALKATRELAIDHTIITNLEMDYNGAHHEFDQIVLTHAGLISIEVETCAMDVVVDEHGTLRIDNDEDTPLNNLGEKMHAKEDALAGYLSESGAQISPNCIHSIVVFANDDHLIKDHFHKVKLCLCGNLCQTIEELCACAPVLDDSQLEAIQQALTKAHNPVQQGEEDIEDLVDYAKELLQVLNPMPAPEFVPQTNCTILSYSDRSNHEER